MSNVIEWKTAAEIMEYLAQQNALVSGMSVAEAAAALGFTKTASGIYVKTIITTAVKSVAGATASAVAPVATTAATTTATNLVLFEGAGGAAQVGGLASVALPVAASLLAAAGGYLVGSEVYKHNDTFLDKLMFPLYDFISGNNIADSLYESNYDPQVPVNPLTPPVIPTMPMIFDAQGQSYLDSRPYLRLKEFFRTEDVAVTVPTKFDEFMTTMGWSAYVSARTPQNIKDYILDHFSKPSLMFIKGTDGMAYFYIPDTYFNSLNIMAYDESGNIFPYNKITGEFYSYGIPHYQYYVHSYYEMVYQQNFNYNLNPSTQGEMIINRGMTIYSSVASYMRGDAPITQPVIGLPSGVTKYTPGTQNLIVPMQFPDEIPEWIPVALPQAVPGIMPEPVEYPDVAPNPTKITPFINPYQPQPADVPVKKPVSKPTIPIIPVPNGQPEKSTTPYPEPNPTTDPSQLADPTAEPVPAPQQVPITEPEIIDTGSTPIPVIPVIPPISSAATGLLHVYNPTNDQINQFGSWLWTTFSGDLIETLSKLFNNPMDAVIGLHELYSTPITGSETTIRAGYLDSGVASRLVSSRYSEIKCGALSVPEYWNNYLDYAPYTKSYCYLPFIGMVELNTDDIVGSGVEITYKIDAYNGSCIAIITTAKAGSSESVTYQYSGNCAVEVPITSGMKSAVQSALIGAATTALAASTGGGGMAAAALIGGARGANSKNLVQHSGSFGSSYGAMGLKIPFIVIKRPKQKVVAGYNDNYGYPAHKMVRISECSGYLKAIEVDVVSPTATEKEKHLIEVQLKSGIFIN